MRKNSDISMFMIKHNKLTNSTELDIILVKMENKPAPEEYLRTLQQNVSADLSEQLTNIQQLYSDKLVLTNKNLN